MQTKRLTFRSRLGESAFAIASRRGFPFLDSATGRPDEQSGAWLARFTKDFKRKGPSCWVGFSQLNQCWVVEEEECET